ncbi:TniQ family protein [Paenirhodobacter sp.]|uniref:TniQ family protein n=1 Tax=Paenirhodobacter sp. TaxID=1965326 RepID=UPI003B3FF671
MTGRERLPVVFAPAADARLSSWIARMAPFYAMTVPEFLAELGFLGCDVFDLEWRLSEGEGALIGARTGVSAEAVQAMTFGELIPEARVMIRRNRHHCPQCPAAVQSKSAALPWVFRCTVHGANLEDVTGGSLSDLLGAGQLAAMEAHAKAGAAILDAWAHDACQQGFGPVEMLALLTVRHRRASPPSAREQPRMSQQTRRDYHEFLTTPIIRQALTVVVPEYDAVAPVLAKPVRPGLHSLAQGSLLQAFALAVGIGRIAETPVDQTISVLLKSDADGQGQVRDALRSWPLSLRRRISARLWRAQRDERERQVAQKPTRRRQSHEYRRVQSHECRSRIS